MICFGRTILDQPSGPEDRHDVAQGGRNSLQRNWRGQSLRSFRYGGSDHSTVTAKQHFPSHAHTSTAVTENNSVLLRFLLCKTTTKKSQTMKCIEHDMSQITSLIGQQPWRVFRAVQDEEITGIHLATPSVNYGPVTLPTFTQMLRYATCSGRQTYTCVHNITCWTAQHEYSPLSACNWTKDRKTNCLSAW